jgi:hypothetical protein
MNLELGIWNILILKNHSIYLYGLKIFSFHWSISHFQENQNSLYKNIRTHRGDIRRLSSEKSFLLEKCFIHLDREKNSSSNEIIFNNFKKCIGDLVNQKLIFLPEKKKHLMSLTFRLSFEKVNKLYSIDL